VVVAVAAGGREAEDAALLGPGERQRQAEPVEGEVGRLGAVEDGLGHIGARKASGRILARSASGEQARRGGAQAVAAGAALGGEPVLHGGEAAGSMIGRCWPG
jgi:hypothetical protein